MEKAIGRHAAVLTQETTNDIYALICQRFEDIRRQSRDLGHHAIVVQSNEVFQQIDDIPGFIAEVEAHWPATSSHAIPHPYIQGLMTNDLAKTLQNRLACSDFYEKELGYRVLSEVLVTNRYGTSVAQTQMLSDYYQADELWWQKARAQGTYIGDVQYDESAGVYAVDLAVGLHDRDGHFSGVLKAALNIRDIFSFAQNTCKRSEYASARLRLVSHNRTLVFNTHREIKPEAAVPEAIL